MKNTEILAPIGSFDILKEAINAGCSACYFSGKSFGARAYAPNFTNDELKDAIDYCHLYGVKAYVTVNTIIFEDEIQKAIDFIDMLYFNQVDAIILQDLGLFSICKKRYPSLKLHASTQINAQTLEDCIVLKNLGFDRVILGREVSLDEVKRIKENLDIELEVFVHGALCMSYSGECLYSSFNGGRSGNRGRCAQPCRMIHKFNDKEKYYLSTKDLETIDYIKEISKYVDSIKIEGRMKSKEYVYDVIKAYHDVLFTNDYNLKELKHNYEIDFNRGYTKGFINNDINSNISEVNFSNHQGVLVGKVKSSFNNKTTIILNDTIYDGDSIRIVGKENDSVIISGMYSNNKLVKVAFNNNLVTVRTHKNLNVGDLVYVTKRIHNESINKKIDIIATISNNNGYFILEYSDGINKVKSKIKYEKTLKNLNERIKEQISKTNDSVYFVKNIIDNTTEQIYVDIKSLNQLRRDLISELNDIRINPYDRDICEDEVILDINDYLEESSLNFLVSSENELNDLKKSLNNYNFDNFNIMTRFKSDYLYFLPRVTKYIKKDNIVSSMLGIKSKISSCYFNVSNSYAIRVMEHLGYEVVGLSLELSKENISLMLSNYKKRYKRVPNTMVLVYGYIDLIYMKHCFINKEFNLNKDHCNLCKKEMLFDENRVYGDSECHLAILSKDPIYLLNKTKELTRMGVNNFLFDFRYCKDINEILNEYYNPRNDGFFGHYLQQIL